MFRLRVEKTKAARNRAFAEQMLAGAETTEKQSDSQGINEVVVKEGLDELAGPVDLNLAAFLCLELRSFLGNAACEREYAEEMDVHIRPATPADRDQLARFREALWPETSAVEHARDLEAILAGKAPGAMPLVILVAETADGRLLGFAEVGLRSHADGCDPARPVGYLEGWYVVEEARRRGVGRRLLAAAEDWARGHGCVEIASDTLIDNELSQTCHEALGFQVVERCVHYRKAL